MSQKKKPNSKTVSNIDTDKQVSTSSTWCANCIFADFDENVQKGCKANRLDKFKKADIPVIQTHIEDTTSFVIDGKSCVYYRNDTWARTYYPDQSDTGILQSIQNELGIPYHAIVFLRDKEHKRSEITNVKTALDNLQNRLSELSNQKVKPKIVTVVNRLHSIEDHSAQIISMIQKCEFSHWKIQTVKSTDQLDTDIIDLSYDHTKKMTYMFYICFESEYSIPSTMSEDIHISLHDNMKSFTVLLPNTQNVGRGALKAAHAKYSGNAFSILLEDKITHYNDAPHLIKKVADICPSLQTS